MAKILQASSAPLAVTLAAALNVFMPCANTYAVIDVVVSAVEANAQITYRTAGTLSNLWCNVPTNSLNSTATLRTRIGGVNGNLSVSISGTGTFEDAVNTDTIAAGNQVNLNLDTTASVSGTIFLTTEATAFTANTDTVIRIGASAGAAINTANTTYFPLGGLWAAATATEANAQQYIGCSGTLKNLYVYISVNTKTVTNTIVSRVDNGGGPVTGNLSVSIPTLTTGIFEDTANSDSLLIGYLSNTAFISGGGTGNVTIREVSTEFLSTVKQSLILQGRPSNNWGPSGNTTVYGPIGGCLTSLTVSEGNVITKALTSFYAIYFSIYNAVNTVDGTTTVTLRKNQTTDTALTVSIPASTAGRFTDTVNRVLIKQNDTLSLKYAAGGTTGALGSRNTAMTADYAVGSVKDIINHGVIPFGR